MNADRRSGFKGEWVEIFSAGSHTDDQGRAHTLNNDFVEAVARNYDATLHEAPAVVGHPNDNAPAYGWVSGIRARDGRLEVEFKDVDPEFEQMVASGRFKKRSASFYVDANSAPGGKAPYLRHVGFLGAQPPAVKGLRDIRFTEGEAVTFSNEPREGETMDKPTLDDSQVKNLAERIVDGIKSLFGKKEEDISRKPVVIRGDVGTSQRFSEADLDARIKKAVDTASATVTANFTEKITALEGENKTLRERVEQQATSTTRSELIAFCEKLGPEKCPPAFRRMGIVEFMEAISTTETKVTVISFEEADGKKTEKKEEQTPLGWFRNFVEQLGPFIQLGEQFGALRATGTDDPAMIADPKRMNELRGKAGLTVVKTDK